MNIPSGNDPKWIIANDPKGIKKNLRENNWSDSEPPEAFSDGPSGTRRARRVIATDDEAILKEVGRPARIGGCASEAAKSDRSSRNRIPR